MNIIVIEKFIKQFFIVVKKFFSYLALVEMLKGVLEIVFKY